MENKEWRFEDEKKKLPSGPWQDEPDKKQWTTKVGLPGLIRRNSSGALCGYVGVQKGHPYFEKEYGNCGYLDVHGGLTYSDFCTDNPNHICHEVCDPAEDHVWWLGFDCAHGYDLRPGYNRRWQFDAEYRDLAYAMNEVESLARQLVEVR